MRIFLRPFLKIPDYSARRGDRKRREEFDEKKEERKRRLLVDRIGIFWNVGEGRGRWEKRGVDSGGKIWGDKKIGLKSGCNFCLEFSDD